MPETIRDGTGTSKLAKVDSDNRLTVASAIVTSTSGGATLYRNVDVDESADEVKSSAGQIYWFHAMNMTAGVIYLQIYNKASSSVTVGTTAADLTFPLTTAGDTNGSGFNLSIPNGIVMDTGITIACTTNIAGAGAPAANACFVNLGYA